MPRKKASAAAADPLRHSSLGPPERGTGDVAYLAAVDEDSLPFDRGCPRNFAEFWRSPPRSEYTFAYNADGSLPRHRFRCCFD